MIFPQRHPASERDKITTVLPSLHRRDFLNRLALGAAGLSFSRLAKGEAATPLKATKLADSFIEITGAGTNILLFTGPDGSLMVDGGLAERSPELLKLVADQSGGKPVRVLFNTHWHCECTGSNEALAKTGTKIVSHENTKLWESTDVIVEWQKRTYQPLPKAALPNDTFYALTNTTRKMTFGDQPVEYGYLPQAHTDGDIYIYFPGPNILMAGDVVSAGSYPILDYSSGGWIGGMSQASKTLLKVANADTRIIPGSGPVLTRADVEAQSEMLAAVMTTLVKMMKEGMGAKDMLAAGATKQFDPKWGDPELFITNAYPGLWGHVRELGGIV
jgi:cyclase